jgi:hypothetical protein
MEWQVSRLICAGLDHLRHARPCRRRRRRSFISSPPGRWASRANLVAASSNFPAGSTVGLKASVTDSAIMALSGAQVFVQIRDAGGLVTSLQGFSDDIGIAIMNWKTSRTQVPGTYTAKVVDLIKSGYLFNPNAGLTTLTFTIQ